MEYIDGCESFDEFYAVVSISLGELVEGGFITLPSKEWDFPKYDRKQHNRLCKKIIDHYYYREIGVLPAGRWKLAFLRKLNEIMPKYIPLYEQLAQGVNIMQTADDYGKRREILSEFPQTMLSGENQDYASSGHDTEYEDIHTGDWIERAKQIELQYNDVDVMIINDLESLFSQLFTVSMNGI